MRTVNMHEAKTHLSRLVERAGKGEGFIIAKAGKPLVKAVPLDARDAFVPRRLGFLVGEITCLTISIAWARTRPERSDGCADQRNGAAPREQVALLPSVSGAHHAVIEEGIPSLRDALAALSDAERTPILIVPILIPEEPNLATWHKCTLQWWHKSDDRVWPEIRVAPFFGDL
jgi:prevent-host-death family protein